MRSYRDFLDGRKVPRGPWVVDGPRFAATGIEAFGQDAQRLDGEATKARPRKGVAQLKLVRAA